MKDILVILWNKPVWVGSWFVMLFLYACSWESHSLFHMFQGTRLHFHGLLPVEQPSKFSGLLSGRFVALQHKAIPTNIKVLWKVAQLVVESASFSRHSYLAEHYFSVGLGSFSPRMTG